MIANKIIKCIYVLDVKDQACEGIFEDAKELNISFIRISSELIDNDIETFNALVDSVDSIKDAAKIKADAVIEFNPEFYPTLNTKNLDFSPTITPVSAKDGVETVKLSPSKVFDERGDYKAIRLNIDYTGGSVDGSVLSDPEQYLKIKQYSVPQLGDLTSTEKVMVH